MNHIIEIVDLFYYLEILLFMKIRSLKIQVPECEREFIID